MMSTGFGRVVALPHCRHRIREWTWCDVDERRCKATTRPSPVLAPLELELDIAYGMDVKVTPTPPRTARTENP
jgi:hypothetical protein